LALLVGIVLFSALTDDPVRSAIPYGVSVGIVAWRHGLLGGFAFSAVATVAALVSGAFPTHPTSAGHEAVEGLITYAQMSVVCLVVHFVQRNRLRKSG
jgi:hypothetical protein